MLTAEPDKMRKHVAEKILEGAGGLQVISTVKCS